MAEIPLRGPFLCISEISAPPRLRSAPPAKETAIARKETGGKVQQVLGSTVFKWHHPQVVPLGIDAEDEWKELSGHAIE